MARVTPFSDRRSRFLAGKFGVGLFLISLGVLFAATLIGFLVIRLQLKGVWPTDLPPLPAMLWMSTLVLIASSATMQWALASARTNQPAPLRVAMSLTLLLGLGFLALQTYCWLSWLGPVSERWDASNEHRYALASFYVLTGLHALHVIGGLVPMIVVAINAWRGRYSSLHHPGVEYVAMYWHFLDGVWLVLFGSLLLGA